LTKEYERKVKNSYAMHTFSKPLNPTGWFNQGTIF